MREAIWLAPFLCIGLVSTALFRPLPHIPPPVHSRTVVDEGGTPVHIALPFRGIVLAPNSFPGTYLEDTHAPELLVFAGNTSLRKYVEEGATTWVYPQILDNKLWNDKLFRATASPYTQIESLIAENPSVYIGCGGPPDFVRRAGLPVFDCAVPPQVVRRSPILSADVSCGSPKNLRRGYYPESYLFPALRSYSALIGHPGFANRRVAAYCEAIDDLQQELQPSSLTYWPRVWARGTEKGSLVRAGLIDVAPERYNPDDPEQILAMDPDMILLANGSPQEFERDIRWQGLKAVHNHRVYRRPGIPEWWTAGVLFQPIETRWIAELAHPDRLRPEVRELLREGMLEEFGYRLTNAQIDVQLHVAENAGSAGTERFTRSYLAALQSQRSK